MASAHLIPSDIAFTPSVKAVQAQKGSRRAYSRMEQGEGWETTVTDGLAGFIAEQRSFYLATANAEGQPYIQHRGGPKGFLRVIDAHTLGFADFGGNRQYISLGNLTDNAKVHLFLMDYAHQRRVKIWGEAKVVENDPELLAKLAPVGYSGRPERAIVISIQAWDANCPQHIPQLIPPNWTARKHRLGPLYEAVAHCSSPVVLSAARWPHGALARRQAARPLADG